MRIYILILGRKEFRQQMTQNLIASLDAAVTVHKKTF